MHACMHTIEPTSHFAREGGGSKDEDTARECAKTPGAEIGQEKLAVQQQQPLLFSRRSFLPELQQQLWGSSLTLLCTVRHARALCDLSTCLPGPVNLAAIEDISFCRGSPLFIYTCLLIKSERNSSISSED